MSTKATRFCGVSTAWICVTCGRRRLSRGKHEEKQLIDKVIAKSGYVGCVFDDDDGVHGIVTLDGKEDYRRFMRAWKAAKQEVMAAGRK